MKKIMITLTLASTMALATDISGNVSGTWSIANSPYYITENATIPAGDTLSIEPGVQVLAYQSTRLTVEGTLLAVGHPDSLITFAANTSDQLWSGVTFDTSGASTLVYCRFEDVAGDWFTKNDELIQEGYWTATYPEQLTFGGNSFTVNDGSVYMDHDIYVDSPDLVLHFHLSTSSYSAPNNDLVYLYVNGVEVGYEDQAGSSFDYDLEPHLHTFIDIRAQFTDRNYGPASVNDLRIDYKTPAGALSIQSSDVTVKNCILTSNYNAVNTESSDLTLRNVNIYQNDEFDLISENTTTNILNSIFHGNVSGHSALAFNDVNWFSIDYSLLQDAANYSGLDGIVIGSNVSPSIPYIIDDDGHLDPVFSPCIDAGHPNDYDACIPPGMGTTQADIGMYGGMNNCGTGAPNLGGGEPDITTVEDMPDDQGGYAGLHFEASLYDGGSDVYDITHYSIWRELDTEGRSNVQFNDNPSGQFYSSSSRDTDDGWEYIGDSPAQEFEIYAYTAPTISDSSSDGIFWSKYLVVAHTPDDDIFFVSDPDSGYSVDNIPPTAPAALSVAFDDGTLTASWEDEINPDILHYDVYRNGSSLLETAEPEFTDDTFDLGDSAAYTIRGVDIHDNTGEFSDPFTATYGTKGDVTWDGIINILDVTKILYIILFPDEEVTDEEYWAGDYNSDEGIDVVDVTPVVDIILGGLLSNMENSGGETMVYLQENTLMLTSYRPITGIQVLLSDNTTVSNLTSLSMAAEANKVLVYTLTGDVLQGVDIPVLALGSDAVIEDIILVDNLGERVSAVLEIVEEDLIPDEFAIHQNYPNPFNPATLIKLDVNKPMHSKISVYDLMGREVNVLVDEKLQPGYHQFIWDGTDRKGVKAGSGLYFILVQTPEVTRAMKATLLR
jgi:hypothetical protein